MRSRILTLTLSDREREQLLEYELHCRGRVGRRARFVLLCDKGYAAPAIARLMDAHPQTVRRWLHRYRRRGLDGLQDKPRSGRPSRP